MSTQVVHNPEESRYELHVDGRVAGAARYYLDGDAAVFSHVEIDPDLRGHGLGAILVRQALDAERTRGRTIVPVCPFVVAFVRRNPEYAQAAQAPGRR